MNFVVINTDLRVFRDKEWLGVSVDRIWWNEEKCRVRFMGHSKSKIGSIKEGDIIEVLYIDGAPDNYQAGNKLFTLFVERIVRAYMCNLNPDSFDHAEVLTIYKSCDCRSEDLKFDFNALILQEE